jgi:hypothetical protein
LFFLGKGGNDPCIVVPFVKKRSDCPFRRDIIVGLMLTVWLLISSRSVGGRHVTSSLSLTKIGSNNMSPFLIGVNGWDGAVKRGMVLIH